MIDFQEKEWIYSLTEARNFSHEIVGNKAYGLSSLLSWGLPVPEGIVLDAKVSRYFLKNNELPSSGWNLIKERVSKLVGDYTDKDFPVLFAVRSGASISMPGMMDSFLNVGINDQKISKLAEDFKKPRFAYLSYISFLDQFIRLILNVSRRELARSYKPFLIQENVGYWEDLSLDSLQQIPDILFQQYNLHSSRIFPAKEWEQLKKAIIAIFNSWNNPRAIQFRDYRGISHLLGTAVIIMPMVYPNIDINSGSGVIFSRNPNNGAKSIVGEYLPGKYGSGIVGGSIQPVDISILQEQQPAVFNQLQEMAEKIEIETEQIQEIEFVVQSGKLWLLQTRKAISSMTAKYKLVQDLVEAGKISETSAEAKIDWDQIKSERNSYFASSILKNAKLIGIGIPASPSVAVGEICFSIEALQLAQTDAPKKLLIREGTKPKDIQGIKNASGIVTLTGGKMSHAAVISRIFRKPCIVGCNDWSIEFINDKPFLNTGSMILEEGSLISIDGNSGRIYLGSLQVSTSTV